MSTTLSQARALVRGKNGDPLGSIFGDSEVNTYLQIGTDDFCWQGLLLWRKSSSHSSLEDVAGTAVCALPTDTLKVERVLWKQVPLEPLFPAELERTDASFQTRSGTVYGYVMEGDGIGNIRKVPAPPTTESGNVGLEDYRRHQTLSLDATTFELPDRYVKFIVFYAVYRCFKRDGPLQNLAAAAHYLQRYQLGLQRVLERKEKFRRFKAARMGEHTPQLSGRPPKPTLPWQFGVVMRHRGGRGRY